MKHRSIRLLVASLALCAVSLSQAQDYPSKPITIIVPFAAGGPSDTVARLTAQTMGNVLKSQMIVENVGGAGGTIGAARLTQAKPDGYTVFIHHIGHATAPALYRKLGDDSIKDFEPIGLVNDGAMAVVARKDFPAANLKEMIAYLKANKEKINMANAGVGSASHLCGMLFQTALATDFITVPYKGTGPAMNDLLGGQVMRRVGRTPEIHRRIWLLHRRVEQARALHPQVLAVFALGQFLGAGGLLAHGAGELHIYAPQPLNRRS